MAYPINAQIRHMLDTIKYDLKQDREWFICLDGKNSVIGAQSTKLFGLQYGYLYNKRTNLFIGYYSSYNTQAQILDNPTALPGTRDSNTLFLKSEIAYLNFGCEYYFKNTKRWRMSFPVALGIGQGRDETYTTKKYMGIEKKLMIPLDFGIYVNYKIKWWLWAGAGIGSRISFASTKYSGSYYTFGLSLRFGAMYDRVRTWYKDKYQ